jgi:predicted aspartyl protease
MASKILSYPSLGDSPTIFVNLVNPETGRTHVFQMLVDTGASRTCLPATRADFLGHNNLDGRVQSSEVYGVGGISKAYAHTLRIELIDPDGKIWSKLVSPWRSAPMPVLFVEKMKTEAGIIGRDILAQWKSVSFHATPKAALSRWLIQIEL